MLSQHKLDNNPRTHPTTLATIEDDSILVPIQEALHVLFPSDINFQMDTSNLEMKNIHESREFIPIHQEIDNASQIKQQAAYNRILVRTLQDTTFGIT